MWDDAQVCPSETLQSDRLPRRDIYDSCPLESTSSHIRTFTLSPSWEQDDLLRGHLQLIDLDPLSWPGDYEALSYVWGDPVSTHTLYIDNSPVGISKNLFAALRRLRYATKPRTL